MGGWIALLLAQDLGDRNRRSRRHRGRAGLHRLGLFGRPESRAPARRQAGRGHPLWRSPHRDHARLLGVGPVAPPARERDRRRRAGAPHSGPGRSRRALAGPRCASLRSCVQPMCRLSSSRMAITACRARGTLPADCDRRGPAGALMMLFLAALALAQSPYSTGDRGDHAPSRREARGRGAHPASRQAANANSLASVIPTRHCREAFRLPYQR